MRNEKSETEEARSRNKPASTFGGQVPVRQVRDDDFKKKKGAHKAPLRNQNRIYFLVA
jgi:hypothetical protein